MMQYVIQSIIGAGGGWLMGQLGKGSGLGTAGNVVAGVAGGIGLPAIVGAVLPTLLGSGTSISSILTSAAGSVLIPYVIGLFNKKTA